MIPDPPSSMMSQGSYGGPNYSLPRRQPVHHRQKLHVGTRSTMFGDRLILRIIKPSIGRCFGGKLEYHNTTLPWVGAFQGYRIIVIG